MSEPKLPEYVNVVTAARWIGFSQRQVREWCKQKIVLEGVKQPSGYAGKYRIPVAALEKLEECPKWLRAELADTAENT